MDPKLLLVLLTCAISSCLCLNTYTDSLVIARKSNHRRVARFAKEDDDSDIDDLPDIPKIYAMRIESNVTNRYATTLVTSKVKNMGHRAQEAVFAVILPEKAFISKFVMTIDGKDYEAYVKEKEQAKQIYNEARARGLGAAHVAASARDSNRFTVSVNIEPSSKATFHLTYEQLLERKNNKYELVINIHPRQPVKDLFVDVHIAESLPLRFVHAPPIRSGNEISDVSGDLDPRARLELINKTSAHVTFKPTIKRQKELATLLHQNVNQGLSGQFVVEYDVERNPNGGEVLLEDGYFIHFFAPPDIEPLPKNVFFVLDTSGSMWGQKILQLKGAMNKILMELKANDRFSLIEFNSNVKVLDINNNNYVMYHSWDRTYFSDDQEGYENINTTFPNSIQVNPANIDKVKNMVNKLEAAGGTNIAGALKVALHLVDRQKGHPNDPQPLIIFLTDGDATVGVTNPERILRTASEQNNHKTPIYCLSFGSDADRNLLQKLALRNNGFSRHIYEGADASLQLEDFYRDISSPIMNNITFKYVPDAKDVTRSTFPILFNGSEIVVTGKIDKEFPTLPTVTAHGAKGPIDFVPEVKKPIAKIERMWAYITVQQLLEQKEIAENAAELEQKALDIALKYSFVTPVSSLVVVKPNSTDDVNLEAGDHKDKSPSLPPQSTVSHLRTAFSSGPRYFFPMFNRAPSEYIDTHDSRFQIDAPIGAMYNMKVRPTPTPPITTTFRPKKQIYTIEQLKQHIPWLNTTLEDNTLRTEKGTYQIGIHEHSPDGITCPVTPLNGTGYCKHLHECPQAFQFLTNIRIFEQYRCELNGFAAVCCPPEES